MNWQDFHFIRPWWLLMLAPLAFGLFRLWRRQGVDSAWRNVVAPELLPHLLMEEEGRLARWPLVVAGLGFTMAVLAMAGPAWERLPQPVFSKTSSLVIALDLSTSMNARDLKPSRLQQARFKVEDILKQRKEGQTALIAFAGAPFTVSPLTDDARTIIAQLPALTPDIMPVQGSNTAAAIKLGAELLQQAGQAKGRILLVTDGVNTAASVEAAREAAKHGYRVSVLGVGTVQGAPIPTRQGVIKDARGNIVIAKLDTAALEEVARAGQGRFVLLSLDASDIAALHLVDDDHDMQSASRASDQEVARWKDMGPWLLLAVLPLAALAFRRGVMILAFIMVLPLPDSAQAGWWSDLWQRPDQQGQELLLDQQQPEQAAQVFHDPDWKASALYRAGKYQEAEKLWQQEDTAEARYNLGNALAREGRLKEAIDAYEQVLKKNPEHQDAKTNLDLVRKLLEKQKQEQKKKQQNQKGRQGKKDQQNQKSQQSQKDQQSQKGQQGQKDQQSQKGQQGQKDQKNQKGQQGQKDQKNQKGQQGQKNQQKQKGQQGQKDQQNQKGQQAKKDEQNRKDLQADKSEAQGEKDKEEQARARAKAEAARKEEERKAEEARKMAEKKEKQKESSRKPQEAAQAAQASTEKPLDEKALSREQWLKRIPDDPGGLLRRKFRYYYQRKHYDVPKQQPW